MEVPPEANVRFAGVIDVLGLMLPTLQHSASAFSFLKSLQLQTSAHGVGCGCTNYWNLWPLGCTPRLPPGVIPLGCLESSLFRLGTLTRDAARPPH